MPVEFLSDTQLKHYGRFSCSPSEEQLARYFHLDDSDRLLIRKRRGDYNRLGFSVQLGTLRFLGTFLKDPTDVPENVIAYVGQQLGIENLSELNRYGIGETRWDHIAEIKACYGYKEFTGRVESFGFVRWLYNRCSFSNERPSILFDLATARLVERKVLLPGATILARLVVRVRERATKNFWSALANLTTPLQKCRLARLLEVAEKDQQSHLDRLRRGPVRISSPALISSLKRIEELRNLDVGSINLSPFPAGRVKALARYASKSTTHSIRRMPESRRMATLLAFAKSFERSSMDDALDLLDLLIDKIFKKARETGKKNRLRTLRDLDRAALDLRKACEVILDQTLPSEHLRAVIFKDISRSRLEDAAERIGQLARFADDHYEEEITERYRSVRRFFPKVLQTVVFSSTPSGKQVLQSLRFLDSIEGKTNPDMTCAPLADIPKSWLRRINCHNGIIDRRAYTLCILERLQTALRRRDIFVPASTKWADPREKLLPVKHWKSLKTRFCHSMSHPKSGEEAVGLLSAQLENAYRETLTGLPKNMSLLLHSKNEKRNFTLSPFDRLEEPESLIKLKKEVSARLPRVDLPEVLLEIHELTGFANEFTHLSEENARAENLVISLCATLMAQACNTGLEPVIDPSFLPLTRHRLSWTMQNYFRAETLIAANARLVDFQSNIPLAELWGGGEVASADGMRFAVPVQTIHAGPNRKYFRGRGVTYYNFTSDQFTGFHQVIIPGTLRDSMYILEGLLEHETALTIREIMADTAGASEIVFGLFWLLGYQFSPRLANIGSARFWRCDVQADYGPLNSLSQNNVKTEKFMRHWDDILRTAASLKMGRVSASELIRSLFNSKRPTALGKAIAELGKIPKTTHMLNFISNEGYRRRILTQLNRGEGRHGLGREVYHGRRGELRQRYREGQEDQLGALGLVMNAIVLWNTIYIQAALDQMKKEGYEIRPEDAARLSPLAHEHFNFLGRYSFRIESLPNKGELRPLRNPSDQKILGS